MNDKPRLATPKLDRRDFLKVTGAGLAAAASPRVPAAFAQEMVELVLWSWLPDFQKQIDLFEKAHPNIKVQLVNAGQGEAALHKTSRRASGGKRPSRRCPYGIPAHPQLRPDQCSRRSRPAGRRSRS
jgi:hypothetical protein